MTVNVKSTENSKLRENRIGFKIVQFCSSKMKYLTVKRRAGRDFRPLETKNLAAMRSTQCLARLECWISHRYHFEAFRRSERE
jgi:hypothetical protein